ncbi:MAG: hypothetical protein L0220_13510 [Acidobacteria bacterium]|nr:hypothetical protein [Acidobacteriota bacterium]
MIVNNYRSITLLLFLISLPGCGGQLYKVAPLPASAPPEISRTSADGLNAGASLIESDRSIRQFEANLPMAGVIAVDLLIVNKSSDPIDLPTLRFELRDNAGVKYKQITPKNALSRVMKFYGDNFYTLEARRRTREDYSALAFNPESPFAPQKERRGVLFFETKPNSTNLPLLTLQIHGAKTEIILALVDKEKEER